MKGNERKVPKSKLADSARKVSDPPIDWLRAAILERSAVLHYDLKTLAKVAHVDYGTFRKYIRKSPWEWPDDVRDRVCKELGIMPVRTVKGGPEGEWRELL